MNIADICPRHRPELRRVGIHFNNPGQRTTAATHLYQELDIACHLDGDHTLYLDLPRTTASWYQGLLERATGTPAFNDWDRA